jgi:ABC-2 type transport system permease protein
MHPSFYMLEKELIEHKINTRLPLFIGLFGFLLFVSLFFSGQAQHDFFFQMEVNGDVSSMHRDFSRDLNSVIYFGAGLISLLLSTLYIPKTLRKERQEGSSMFWRSMPVSNVMTHAVKLGFGLVVIPAICALLVLFADSLFWILNISSEQQLALIVEQQSLFYVLTNWVVFFGRMLLVALVLLPLATMTLAISQLVNSPLLVILISSFAIKWLAIALFGFYGINDFFSVITSLPMKVLTTSNPFSALSEVSILSLSIYVLLGIGGYLLSLKLNRTDDVSLKTLFQR